MSEAMVRRHAATDRELRQLSGLIELRSDCANLINVDAVDTARTPTIRARCGENFIRNELDRDFYYCCKTVNLSKLQLLWAKTIKHRILFPPSGVLLEHLKRFIPNIAVKDEMLEYLGISNIDELFSDIPEDVRIQKLNIPNGTDEASVKKEMRRLAEKNRIVPSFLGGGLAPHYVPSVVQAITSRSEFYTSYTPYQAEISQGMLQSIFEYQSIIADLTGMDVANASLYDWATALGEAARMCFRINGRKKFLIPRAMNWEKKSVLWNYIRGLGMEILEYGYDEKTGCAAAADIKNKIDYSTSGLYLENPNFFGIIEEDQAIADIVHTNGAVFVVGADPVSLGCLKAPGEYGADIVIGEGQTLGGTMSFGGPLLGIFACKNEFVRHMPGRLVGLTKDTKGRRAFCLTLQAREQHIRRSRATSNICTNEALCALQSLVYLSWLGAEGLNKLAIKNMENARKGFEALISAGCKKVFTGAFFNEFVVRYPASASQINRKLLENGIQGGLSLERYGAPDCALYCFTEVHTEEDIERLAVALKEVL